MKSVGAFG